MQPTSHAPHDDRDDLGDLSGIEIAIVGLSGRFPGADDIDAFWRNLRDGVDASVRLTDEALRERGVPQAVLDEPGYVKAAMPFNGFDLFDAGFFGYTPREAEQLDPQQRVFLECAWSALEHAGCDTARVDGKVGVYAGEGSNVYLMRHLLPSSGLDDHAGIADLLGLMSANAGGSLCTRVAYKLNLRGPAVSVQTACSTSLTAVHTACQALLAHDCDLALAGGVWLNLLQPNGYRHQAGAILSPDGRTRAFDARAAGTVIGSGAGVVVLKRLDEALRDGDTVHAVIKGTAANNDGSAKVGFTAPSVDGQAEVIRAAQLVAGVSADTLGYVEAHGTGTTLGDPIEVAALTQAFRIDTTRRGFCALGSVKTNIGHLDAAAGVAGLIKTTLALRHRTLPASLNFERPNPQIDFETSPFRVNTETRAWPAGPVPRRAGVSSFGIGGTNVHVVLQEAPRRQDEPHAPAGWQVLPLSARSENALAQAAQRLADHLEAEPGQPLADVAQTLQNGRQAFAWRAAVVADAQGHAVQALRAEPEAVQSPAAPPEVVFLFPGGGTQHVHMGLALYQGDPAFRDEIDQGCELLAAATGLDLRPVLYPAPGAEAAAEERLRRIDHTQPALFLVTLAMAHAWMRRGVQPVAMLGHSLGEYVAACLAGVFRFEDALGLVAERGRLMQSTARGAMTAVPLHEAALAPYLDAGCDLAAVNGESLCVLAGPLQAIEAAERRLSAEGVLPRRLHVSMASHSALMDPITERLRQAVAAVPRQAPRLPFLSNVTGRPITADEATDPAYWARHLRGTVRFADGLAHLLAQPGRVLLEVGPGDTLSALARQHPQAEAAAGIWASQLHPQQQAHNARQFATTLAALWRAGVPVDWNASHPGRRARRVPLPTYPFQRQSYWRDASAVSVAPTASSAGPFHVPTWQRTDAPAGSPEAPAAGTCTLVIGDPAGLAGALVAHLRARWPGSPVVQVSHGDATEAMGRLHHVVRAGERADFEAVLRRVQAAHGPVARIHHLGGLDTSPVPDTDAVLDRSFHSLLALAQALETTSAGRTPPLALQVVVNQMEDVSGTEDLCPAKATVFGLAKVIGQEQPHIDCRVVDVVLPHAGSDAQAALVRQLVAEPAAPPVDTVVAWRGPHRWVKGYAPWTLPESPQGTTRLKQRGVYLITGGLGGVGLAVARHFAQAWQAKLVLLGRSPLPAPADRARVADDPAQPPALRDKLRQLAALEALGAEVLALQADVADPAQMQAVVEQARARFGAVHGVVHAAGHAHSAMIGQRTRAMVDAVLAPKLAGTRSLLQALQHEPLDFVLLCSSISSLAGGLGKSDYAAANAYLDAVAARAQRRGGPAVISVNWDAWRDLGMAAGLVLPDGVGMSGPEGAHVLERIVNGPARAQVVISTTDLAQRLGPLDNGMLAQVETGPVPARARRQHPRPALGNAFVAPEGELELALAGLWQDLLGITGLGAHDNLFELGGDSLLAIQILARARKAYDVELHPAAFFKAPTVRDLALLVETRLLEDIESD